MPCKSEIRSFSDYVYIVNYLGCELEKDCGKTTIFNREINYFYGHFQ